MYSFLLANPALCCWQSAGFCNDAPECVSGAFLFTQYRTFLLFTVIAGFELPVCFLHSYIARLRFNYWLEFAVVIYVFFEPAKDKLFILGFRSLFASVFKSSPLFYRLWP